MARSRDALLDTLAGNYRLVAKLGSGGMGDVYKGVHETIGSKVAIKLLHATADASNEARFLREAQAVNRIDHDGVVKVLDAGRLPTGRPFLVMELLDGFSAYDLMRQGPIPIAEACRIIADALDALDAAHAANVIHRDLKPPNIFRTKNGRVVVLDFGVAKLLEGARLTLTNVAIGTPHYMAPEQIESGRVVGPSADLYAAGVVLFELLCRRRPFTAEDPGEVMLAHLEKRPPPPRAIEPAIPQGISDLVLAALAKDPAKRPPSAAAMRDALRAVTPLASQPPAKRTSEPAIAATLPDRPVRPMHTPATVPSVPKPVDKTLPDGIPSGVVAHRQRSRKGGVALVAVAAGLVGGGVAALYVTRDRPAPTPVAQQPVVAQVEIDAAPLIDAAPIVDSPVDTPPLDAAIDAAPVDAASASVMRRFSVSDAGVAAPPRDASIDFLGGNPFKKPNPYETAVSPCATGEPGPGTEECARISIESTPTNGTVLLDGRVVGQTPMARFYPARDALLEIVLKGYVTYAVKLKLARGKATPVKVKLIPRPKTEDDDILKPF